MPIPIILSLSESARLFGVSPRTLRRAIAAEEIPFTLVQGRYKLNFPDLLKWSEHSSRTRLKRDTDGVGQYVSSWKTGNPVIETAPITSSQNPTEQPLAFKRATEKVKVKGEEPTLNWD